MKICTVSYLLLVFYIWFTAWIQNRARFRLDTRDSTSFLNGVDQVCLPPPLTVLTACTLAGLAPRICLRTHGYRALRRCRKRCACLSALLFCENGSSSSFNGSYIRYYKDLGRLTPRVRVPAPQQRSAFTARRGSIVERMTDFQVRHSCADKITC